MHKGFHVTVGKRESVDSDGNNRQGIPLPVSAIKKNDEGRFSRPSRLAGSLCSHTP
jgi:hypothetical protein